MSEDSLEIAPIVSEFTRAQSENVETIISRLNSGRIIIPDYQRDAEQWDLRKESLFIESLLIDILPTLKGWGFCYHRGKPAVASLTLSPAKVDVPTL